MGAHDVVKSVISQADMSERLGNTEQALAFWREAMSLEPTNSSHANQAARLCLQLHHYDEAIQHLSSSLTLSPGQLETMRSLVKALAFAGHYEDALAHVDDILKAQPQDRDAISLRFYVLILMGRYMHALDISATEDSSLQSRTDILALLYLENMIGIGTHPGERLCPCDIAILDKILNTKDSEERTGMLGAVLLG